MTWMQTFSGIKFDLENPDAFMIKMQDIAISLSRQLRFNGHTKLPYSIAQHSILVADLVLQAGGTYEQVLAALLHDAHETYTSDIPSPVKWVLGNHWAPMKEVQKRVDDAIAEYFGFDAALFSDPLIKHADGSALWHEKHALLDDFGHNWNWEIILHGKEPLLLPNADHDAWMDLSKPWHSEHSYHEFFFAVRSAMQAISTPVEAGSLEMEDPAYD